MQFVALLRGINVGGRSIPMTALRDCFAEMGFDEVTTVQQTGNVIFFGGDSPEAIKQTIEAGLSKKFSYPAHVQVLTMERLRTIIEASPFDANDSLMHSYVVFFENGKEKELLSEVEDLGEEIEQVRGGDGVLYWRVPKGSTLQSAFAKYLTKARYKDSHTNRNINTLRKVTG